MKFKNPSNGYIEEVSDNVGWIVLFFGPFYFAVKGVWTHCAASLIIAFCTGGISWLIYPFFAKSIMENHYLKNGWKNVRADSQGVLKRQSADIKTSTEKYSNGNDQANEGSTFEDGQDILVCSECNHVKVEADKKAVSFCDFCKKDTQTLTLHKWDTGYEDAQKELSKILKYNEKFENTPEERECPFCAELIKSKAIKCKHCGSEVEPLQSTIQESYFDSVEFENDKKIIQAENESSKEIQRYKTHSKEDVDAWTALNLKSTTKTVIPNKDEEKSKSRSIIRIAILILAASLSIYIANSYGTAKAKVNKINSRIEIVINKYMDQMDTYQNLSAKYPDNYNYKVIAALYEKAMTSAYRKLNHSVLQALFDDMARDIGIIPKGTEDSLDKVVDQIEIDKAVVKTKVFKQKQDFTAIENMSIAEINEILSCYDVMINNGIKGVDTALYDELETNLKEKEEDKLYKEVQQIPFGEYELNLSGYKRLAEINPDNKVYKNKIAKFERLLNNNKVIGIWKWQMAAGTEALLTMKTVNNNYIMNFVGLKNGHKSGTSVDSDLIKGRRNGKQVFIVKNNEAGEYYKIMTNGNLAMYDKEGLIDKAIPAN